MILVRNFANIFRIPELRKKILFTLGVFIIYRLGNYIPAIGIDIAALSEFLTKKSTWNALFSYLDIFSGGNLRNCTIFALGIQPYILASLMMQLLGLSIPYLEQLLKEGEYGRKVVNQYTRYLAVGISLLHSTTYLGFVEYNGLAISPGWGFRLLFIMSLVVGAVFVMWLGEQISLYGIGSGSSMLIFAGIVSRFLPDIIKTVGSIQEGLLNPIVALALFALALTVGACIVFFEKGERKIPVHYTKRVVGTRVYGGQSAYIPFKINIAGIMPVIFANAVLNVPVMIISSLATRFSILTWLADGLKRAGGLYNMLDFALIIAFSFFYSVIAFPPEESAENMRKSGGFVPGFRPGRKTAEFFTYLLTRLGLVGAIYLATLAVLPNIIYTFFMLPFELTILSGTSLLIVVGVALDFASQVEAYLIEHRYEGFLTTGRIKGRTR